MGCVKLSSLSPVEKRPACSTSSQLDLEMDADKGKQRQYSQRWACRLSRGELENDLSVRVWERGHVLALPEEPGERGPAG